MWGEKDTFQDIRDNMGYKNQNTRESAAFRPGQFSLINNYQISSLTSGDDYTFELLTTF